LTKIGVSINAWKIDPNVSRRLTELGLEGHQKELARYGDKGQAETLLVEYDKNNSPNNSPK